MISNKELDGHLRRISKGSKNALASLYQETKSMIYAYSLSILKNRELAEDALQDTYIKIYENAYLYNSKDKPLAWMFTISKNICYMKFRKQKDYVNIDDISEILTISKNDIDDKLFLSYLFSNVSDEERTIVLLHAVSGFKHREIAKFMDMPVGTVLSKYKRTMNKLRELASKEEEL